ncbi:hypothetical protein [Haliscomenobacter sp.]|uniref:hypothetical protein n=1 Tax=Haliscomenobacter sp. TaxID=2717303 RepID=UPI003BAD8670
MEILLGGHQLPQADEIFGNKRSFVTARFSQFLTHLGTLSFKNFISLKDNRKPPGFSLNND